MPGQEAPVKTLGVKEKGVLRLPWFTGESGSRVLNPSVVVSSRGSGSCQAPASFFPCPDSKSKVHRYSWGWWGVRGLGLEPPASLAQSALLHCRQIEDRHSPGSPCECLIGEQPQESHTSLMQERTGPGWAWALYRVGR